MNLAMKLHTLCNDRRMTQADLRRAIGDTVSASIVSDWFKGDRKPNLDAALMLARALDVSLDWLADDQSEMPPTVASGLAQIDPEDSKILEMVQILGRERAKRRLMGVITPEDVRPAQWD